MGLYLTIVIFLLKCGLHENTSLCSSDGKASAYNAGDLGSIPGSGTSSEEGNGNPLQCCLEKSHGWSSLLGYRPWGHKELDMTERLLYLLHENMPLNIPRISAEQKQTKHLSTCQEEFCLSQKILRTKQFRD